MSQIHFSDETLMAYADGELDPALARQIEDALDGNPDVARRILGFVRSRRMAGAAFSLDTAESVPPALEAVLKSKLTPMSRPAHASFVMPGKPANDVRPQRRYLWPLVAAIALLLGGVAGVTIDREMQTSPATGGLLAGLDASVIQDRLSRLPSGSDDTTALGTLRPIASFKTAAGDLCRWFTFDQQTSAAQAVACYNQGHWNIDVVNVASGKAGADYIPAGESNGIIAAYLQSIRAGTPLDPSAEQEELLRLGSN